MVTALVSALTGRAVRRDVAMTGEVTLRGNVLAIGGLREKSMAAYKAGVSTVIIPAQNEKDLADIDSAVKERITFIPVKNARQVLEHALCKPSAQKTEENVIDTELPPIYSERVAEHAAYGIGK